MLMMLFFSILWHKFHLGSMKFYLILPFFCCVLGMIFDTNQTNVAFAPQVVNDLLFSGSSDTAVHAHNIHVSPSPPPCVLGCIVIHPSCVPSMPS